MSRHLDLSAAQVTAVLVAHDGARWLPTLVGSLKASTRRIDVIVAVDTGSTDDSAELLREALGPSSVVEVARSTGFGDAVARGLAAGLADLSESKAAVDEWLWLLHDDCAPAPDALERLLEIGTADETIAVVGGRLRAWPRGRRLLEVGVSITGTGHREAGLEAGEQDQGQHDEGRDVLAVSTAGMLVRRQVWDRLGGLDPRLPLFRDDVDLGWRVARAGGRVVVAPHALVFHAEAGTRGVRQIDNTSSRPHRADRRAALFTLLANCSGAALPWMTLRLLGGSVLRALGYLLGKLPAAAGDELVAMLSVLGRPDHVLSARHARRRTATTSASAVRPLLPAWWTPYANGLDSLMGRFADELRERAGSMPGSARRLRSGRGDASVLESGPVPEEAVNLPTGAGPASWATNHPLLPLVGLLAVSAFAAARGLWGAGLLQGGALLPAPDAVSAWWRLYTETWHPVSLGSTEAAPPYVLLLAFIGVLTLGHAWLVVDTLLLLAVPLAALGAFAAAGALVRHQGVRTWAAASYALLLVVTGTTTTGHLGTAVAAVVAPWLLRSLVRLLAVPPGAWRHAFASALWLAVMSAFCPLAWVLAVAMLVAGTPWLLLRRSWHALLRCTAVVVAAACLLLPWSLRFLDRPALLLTEAGVVDPVQAPPEAAWKLAVGRLGGAGDAPWWLTGGLLLAALVALSRKDRRGPVAIAWVVLAVAVATSAWTVRQLVDTPAGGQAIAWVGLPVLMAQAAAVAAGALAADGLGSYVRSGDFGWRQPVVAVTAVVGALTPLAGLLWWVAAAPHGELVRQDDTTLPAYLVDSLAGSSQQRVLVLRGDQTHATYEVVMDDGLRLGDDSVGPPAGSDELDALVADVLSVGQPQDAARLAELGIAYVVLPTPADLVLAAKLDALPDLSRASTDAEKSLGWKVDLPTGLVRLLDSAKTTAVSSAAVLGSSSGSVDTKVGAGQEQRLLWSAAEPGEDFTARLDGQTLAAPPPRAVAPGEAAFVLGPDAGRLVLEPPQGRLWWLLGQASLWIVAIVLAAPAVRRRDGIGHGRR